jgi:hypothetical protein
MQGVRISIPLKGDLKEKVFPYFPGFGTFAWEDAAMPI